MMSQPSRRHVRLSGSRPAASSCDLGFGCTYFLRISNLAEWNGQKNPVSDIDQTYVVASDGLSSAGFKIGSADVSIVAKRLGCPAPDVTCGPADSHVFEFSATGAAPLTVPMGQSLPWTVNGQNLTVRNHRSYASGLCDDYWDWGFTVVPRAGR
jgi:hypothetical protein